MSIYDFKAVNLDDEEVSFEAYRGKVLMIVNTASKCGFTYQYEGLQALYDKYNEKGFEIVGFPCNQFMGQEPGSNSDVKTFCSVNYGVTFEIFQKGDVIGEDAQPIFKYLTSEQPFKGFTGEKAEMMENMLKTNFPQIWEGDGVKWNFTKFLVDREGNVVGRFEPTVDPQDIEKEIEKYL
ncbi:MAG: glutathione peroxidase [Firmicutes bacterium]|nr:glutathione peroxidase [Bacillota bacterium]